MLAKKLILKNVHVHRCRESWNLSVRLECQGAENCDILVVMKLCAKGSGSELPISMVELLIIDVE